MSVTLSPTSISLSFVILVLLVIIYLLARRKPAETDSEYQRDVQSLNDKMFQLGAEVRLAHVEILQQLTSLQAHEPDNNQYLQLPTASSADTAALHDCQRDLATLKQRNAELLSICQGLQRQQQQQKQQPQLAMAAQFCLYREPGGKHPAASELFYRDIKSRPEQVLFGSAINRLLLLLEKVRDSQSQSVFAACSIQELCDDLRNFDFLTCFQQKLGKDVLIGCWQALFWKVLRAQKLITTYWPQQQVLLAILSDFILVLDFVMQKNGIRPHPLTLLNIDATTNAYITEDLNCTVNPALATDAAFIAKVKPLASSNTVFCDIAFWGIDARGKDGKWTPVYPSRLIAIGQEYPWSS